MCDCSARGSPMRLGLDALEESCIRCGCVGLGIREAPDSSIIVVDACCL